MDQKLPSRKRPPPSSIDHERPGEGLKKWTKNGGDINDDTEEDVLLAALGSTMQSMDTYEESVIRSAELSSTPRLMSTHSAENGSSVKNGVTAGFPSLVGLVPSRNVHADLPHVQRVLETLRKKGLRSEKDFLKEQMLLSLLHTATDDTELCVRPQAEARQELERKRHYRKQNKEQIQDELTTPNIDNPANPRNLVVPGKSSLKNKTTPSIDNSNHDHDLDEHDIEEDTPGSRLEAIKRGNRRVSFAQGSVDSETSRRSNKASIILPPSVLRPKMSKRISIQDRRKELADVWATDSKSTKTHEGEEEERDLENRKAALKQRRKEREERRRKRLRDTRNKDHDDDVAPRRIRNGKSLFSAESVIDDEDNASDKEAEFEFTGETSRDAQQTTSSTDEGGDIPAVDAGCDDPPISDSGSNVTMNMEALEGPIAAENLLEVSLEKKDPKDENLVKDEPLETTFEKEDDHKTVGSTSEEAKHEFDPIVSASAASTTSVICPLCQKPVSRITAKRRENIDQNDRDADAVLAQHMSICQTGRATRPRNDRGSSKFATSLSSSITNETAAATTRTMYGRQVRLQNYAEDGDRNLFDADDDSDEVEAMETERRARNKQVRGIDEGDDDDDIEMLATNFGKEDLELISSKLHNGKRKSAKTSTTPTPVDDWDENDYEDRVDDWIDHGLDTMKVMKERDIDEKPPGQEIYEGGLSIPAWINDRLFPYQRTGLQWMWELHRQQSGGILGDEMGLGKTVQVASFLGSMAASRKLRSILIISPATMLQHWLKEMATWAPGVRRILVHQSGDVQSSSHSSSGLSSGRSVVTAEQLTAIDQWLKKSRRNRLFEMIDEEDLTSRNPSSFCGTAYAFVTTFENVRRNEEIWTRHRWSYVVMDEAQKIRNPSADITLVCKRLKTPHRLALSGTPIQNDLRELWSLFDFVFPGRLGTLPAFETEFADPIKRGGYTNATPMQVQLAYRCALILKDLINPYLLRRLKKDIKEVQRMPGKKEQVLFCRLTNRQRMLYEAFLQSDIVKKVFRGAAQLLGAITTLRKICNHPDLVCLPGKSSLDSFLQNGFVDQKDLVQLSDGYDSDGALDLDHEDNDSENGEDSMVTRSGKLEVLAKILPLWKEQGHRVLIFCQWKKMLNIIERFTEMQGWKFGRLDGDTNVASRQRLVDKFNSDDSYFGMLCTTRTGGVGLNLVGADRIILYDPDWNPQTDAQARERAWRFGQEREVTIYRLICAGTVEEKIYQRQIFKTALSNRVLQDPRQRRLFSQKDLKDLFTLKADSGSIKGGAEGMTETTVLTKGDGYIDPDKDLGGDDQKDDGETMRNVLKSKGLAGVFDHDVVENTDKNKKGSILEMEAKARRIAREALHALEASVAGHDAFDPESRFGIASAQSASLLSSIAKRNADIKNATSSTSIADTVQYTELLKELRTFVRSNVPTTDEILHEFSSRVSSLDAAVFRRLLKSFAFLDHGRWRFK